MNKTIRVILITIGAISVVTLFLFFLGSPAVNNPGICGKLCHSLNPAYQSWQVSAHASINCRDCHISSHYLEITQEKLLSMPMRFWLTISGSDKLIVNSNSDLSQSSMPAERCERCHRNSNRNFTFSVGTNMNHEAHNDAGIACAVCHNRVAHPRAETFDPIKTENSGFAYKDFLTMKTGCWRCHSWSNLFRDPDTLRLIKNGKNPPSDCRVCHNRDFDFPEGHIDVDWRTKHSTAARKNYEQCLTCHAPGKKFDNNGKIWCSLCHDEQGLKKKLGLNR